MDIERKSKIVEAIDPLQLKEATTKSHLQAVFFDLDGTLVSSDYSDISKRRAEGVIISQLDDEEKIAARNYFRELAEHSLWYWGSTISRWPEVIKIMTRRYPQISNTSQNESLDILLGQHKGSFPLLEGVGELLSSLKKCGIKINIVTMSEEADAKRKCTEGGISEFIDSYHCVVDEVKMPEHWKKAALNTGSDRQYSIAAGDHLTFDVTAALLADFRWVVWFNSKNELMDDFYGLSQIGVREVKNAYELYRYLLQLS